MRDEVLVKGVIIMATLMIFLYYHYHTCTSTMINREFFASIYKTKSAYIFILRKFINSMNETRYTYMHALIAEEL